MKGRRAQGFMKPHHGSVSKLAGIFNITPRYINMIVTRKRWKHLR